MNQVILFLNGEINLPFCERYIQQHHCNLPIYCADGAFNQIKYSTILYKKIQLVIGDGDSMTQIKAQVIPYRLIKNQYATDFEKSLQLLIDQGVEKIIIFGLGGKEMDHYLGNVSTLLCYQDHIRMEIVDAHTLAYLVKPNTIVDNVRGRMISIVPLFQLSKLSLRGLAYNLNEVTLTFGKNIGIRNHAIENQINITYKSGSGLLFISHQPYHGLLTNSAPKIAL